MTRQWIRSACLLALICLAAGCGEADIPTAVDDFANRTTEGDDIYVELTAQERACVLRNESTVDLDAMVNDVGPVGDDARTSAVQATLDCVDDPVAWDGWVASIGTTLEENLGNGVRLEMSESRCLMETILSEAQDPARLLAVGDRPSDQAVLADAFDDCLSADNLDRANGAVTDFVRYGDDPRLDAIHDDCEAGDDRACDYLWFSSGVGTEYEAFAEDCGGHGAGPSGWCSGLELGSGMSTGENDPMLLELIDDCRSGDATACDLAYLISPIGGPAEDEAFSCGGRFPLGRDVDCRATMAE